MAATVTVISSEDVGQSQRVVADVTFDNSYPHGGEEVLAERGLKLAFFDAGGVKIELLEGLGEDPISNFIESRGPGIHHICFKVADVDEAAASLRADGYEFVTDAPYEGAHGSRVIFMKPSSTFGVLIELIQEG